MFTENWDYRSTTIEIHALIALPFFSVFGAKTGLKKILENFFFFLEISASDSSFEQLDRRL